MENWSDKNNYSKNAFGMRINTPDVNLIIYFNFPLSLGQYVQESRRAGRDYRKAKSVIFYSKSELKFLYGIISEKKRRKIQMFTTMVAFLLCMVH